MNSINVMVITKLGKELLEKIATVSPKIKVNDGADLFTLVGAFVVEKKDTLSQEKINSTLSQTEILYGFSPPENLIALAPNLKWIQCPLAGVDRFLLPEIINSQVILTNSRGIHGHQVSESAFEKLLMLSRRSQFYFDMKREHKWQKSIPGILHGKVLGVLGLGVIGTEVAKLGKAFGMKVMALEIKTVEPGVVDAVYPPARLKELLSLSDYVVVALPLTPETRKIINESALRAMKPTAFLVNVARGPIVDEDALIRALKENWISGAGLDVFSSEPLPPESPLWDIPNLVMSPHIAGERADYYNLAVDLFCKNLKNYVEGRELFNIIDKKRGY